MSRTPTSAPVKPAQGRGRLGPALAAALILASALLGYGPALRLRPMAGYAPLQKPFRDAELFRAPDTAADHWKAAHGAAWLDPITSQPQAAWLNGPQDLANVPILVRQAQRQGAIPVLVAYYVPHRDCDFGAGAPTAAEYDQWIGQLIAGIGPARAVIIMEPDAVPAECFNAERAALLKRSVKRLAGAGQYVYLDAGHSRWRSATETARRLIKSGIPYAEGFSVNVSNRHGTSESYRWGLKLSRLVGYRDFVIDTSRNGRGPPDDRDDGWCNPAGQALGDRPTTKTRRPSLAATLWIKRPGESDGYCGTDYTFDFSPRQARELIINSPHVPRDGRRQAAVAGLAADS